MRELLSDSERLLLEKMISIPYDLVGNYNYVVINAKVFARVEGEMFVKIDLYQHYIYKIYIHLYISIIKHLLNK